VQLWILQNGPDFIAGFLLCTAWGYRHLELKGMVFENSRVKAPGFPS
jgi:hypothetical protein